MHVQNIMHIRASFLLLTSIYKDVNNPRS